MNSASLSIRFDNKIGVSSNPQSAIQNPKSYDPKGTILIGSYGRVDMTGDDGTVMLMLFEWEKWEFAIRTPSLKRWPLTEESFSDALKEVMRK